jgi:hypothetical protein
LYGLFLDAAHSILRYKTNINFTNV